jgi:hypothetical protein
MRGGDERSGGLVASHAKRMRNRGKEEIRERRTRGAAGHWKSQLPRREVTLGGGLARSRKLPVLLRALSRLFYSRRYPERSRPELFR